MIKRAFDILAALVLLILLSPIILFVVIWMVVKKETPIFYISERMKTVEAGFNLIKFRTMRNPDASEENSGVSGADKNHRITGLGKVLRRYRLDELPQLINVLRGDMSFVGPRPPLRQYTESHRALYSKVLQAKPGITGLASLYFHEHEERLLSLAQTPKQTDEIYVNRCIPRKARLDLIYLKRSNICFDVKILLDTLARVARRKSRNKRENNS